MTQSIPPPSYPSPERQIYTNRTLNLRAIKAIGYDMDYTLIHYRVEAWERAAYLHTKTKLLQTGWPIEHLSFVPSLVIRGLIFDTELGNIVKTNRFGYVKRAIHGTRPLEYEEQRQTYAREIVDLAQDRYVFMNTLFSLSEGCLYAQLVDLLDQGRLPGVMGYRDLYKRVRTSIDEAHFEGFLKAEIMGNPDRFVDHDPDTARALLDQKESGKKLLLITNSDWEYTHAMMSYAFEGSLPKGMRWRDLFDVVIIAARKPDFFSMRAPLFEVVSEEGLLRPAPKGIQAGGIYLGGSAQHVEQKLGLSGDQILFVGDHIWGDVRVSKSALRWRTALVLRELEEEISTIRSFSADQKRLDELMAHKERLEFRYSHLRLEAQRRRVAGLPDDDAIHRVMSELRAELVGIDERVQPLAKAAAEMGNPSWGPLLRAGNDKSALARQVERSADIYMSRVSNFLFLTPFSYLRSPRGSLPHDPSEGSTILSD
ncbi:MAG: HAD-IG family 5'-nucleotidase [Myxococcota bacterium]